MFRTIRKCSPFSEYSFSQLDIHKYLQSSLSKLGFVKLTKVQSLSFVSLSNMRDVVLSSETGSGKTLAYLLPLFNNVLNQSIIRRVGLVGRPPAVIVAPTMELCEQILAVAKALDSENRVSKQLLTGTSFNLREDTVIEAPRIRWGLVDIVLTTPAMFASDIERFRGDKLFPVCTIFDEADLLFHAHPSVMDILGYLRSRKSGPETQCVFASATLPSVGPFTIGNILTQRFQTAEIIRTDDFHSVPKNIRIEWIPELEASWDNRCFLLTKLLHENENQNILIFTNSNKNCKLIFSFLNEKKWPIKIFSRSINSEISSGIWVCTDLASRGIDWENIDLVINFQMPTDIVTWIHRAGRTGRMGTSGRVVSFYKQSEQPLVDMLKAKSGESLSKLFSHKRSLRKKLDVSKNVF